MREHFYRHLAHTSDSPMGLEIESAEGSYIYTMDGGAYIDFISGIAVSSLGHRHPAVTKAIHEQVDKHLHVMVYGEFIQRAQADFAALIASQLPPYLDRVYFVNSGTEANEGALKLAKKHTGRSRLLAFKNSYHGDTHGSLSVTGRNVYRDPYLPLLPDVHFFDFNEDEILSEINSEVAAVILEPIQGEGGIIPAKKDWLQRVRDACTKAGALLIYDEIQSGFGRTGSLFAFQQYGIAPDILCMAKAMGGGMPIGGFASSSEIFETFKYEPPLNHVTTFGGHPVSCAAGLAALKVLLEEGWMNQAANIEKEIRNELSGCEGVKEIRGIGAMLGLELDSRERTERMVMACMEEGLILGWTLHSNTLVRLAPPLTIPIKTLKKALTIIKKNLK